MDIRKQKETGFHDKIRDKELERDIDQYKYLISNKKFYSVARQSREFIDNFLIEKSQEKKVLDYCCGNGQTVIFLAQNGAEQAVGIDISSTSIENARSEAARMGLDKNAEFFIMDAENLKFEDNYFDLIVCRGVLHHLNIESAYRELARVLKLDGEIIAAEPLVYNPIFQLYRKRTPHLRTKWEMEHILSKKEIDLAKNYFGKVETKFFHLATLLAVPFRNSKIFNPLLKFLEAVDSMLLRLPGLKWLSWQVVFIFSKPQK